MQEIEPTGRQINMPPARRPVFLNLLQIHLPLMGWISILHRLTGIFLFLLLPLPLWLLQHSLVSSEGFEQVSHWFKAWPLRLVMLMMLWWFLHHLLAGIRFLLLDMEIGSELKSARSSAKLLLLFDLLLFILCAWWLL